MSSEDRTSSSGGTRQSPEQHHVVGELNNQEKQQLFLKKLYRLSQAYIAETPQDGLEQNKPTAVASMVFSQPTTTLVEESAAKSPAKEEEESSVTPPPPSPLISFASRLSELTSCVALDFICAPAGRGNRNNKAFSRQRGTTNTTSMKKLKSPLLKKIKLDIPETIILEPSHVSRLGDDDSLARHISILTNEKTSPPPPLVIVDDVSKSSPQCVAQMSTAYEMEISRIIPISKEESSSPKAHNGKRNRFSSFTNKYKNRRCSYELEADEMEF